MKREAFLQGYLAKEAQGPVDWLLRKIPRFKTGPGGGVRMAADQQEQKRKRILNWVKAMQAYRQQQSDQTRDRRMNRLSDSLAVDWVKGTDLAPKIREELESRGISMRDDAEGRSILKPRSRAYPIYHAPPKPQL